MNKPSISLATDHAGFELKNAVKEWLITDGYTVIDHGAHQFNEVDDYPDYISLAAKEVAADPTNRRAVLFGGSGQGEAMLANRFVGVRATVYYGGSEDIITLSREHNDANALSIGARFVDIEQAKKVIALWLTTASSPDEKYHRRNVKLDRMHELNNE